jgi:hypothetical protein
MHAFLHYRRWLFSLALALPVIFLPLPEYMGLNSERFSFGIPPTLYIHMGGINDGRILHFEPSIWLFLSVVVWTLVARLAWQARLSAIAHPSWLGAFVQAFLTSLYCVVLFLFFYGLIYFVWCWQLYSASWLEFDHALHIARRRLLYLYSFGVAAVFVTLFFDSRLRRGYQRLVHVAFVLLIIYVIALLSPYAVWQVQELDGMAIYANTHRQ